jgi:integrase
MRPQEWLAVSWSALDLKKCQVSVERTVVDGLKGGGWNLSDQMKTLGSRRVLAISERLRDRLLLWKEQQEKWIRGLKRARRKNCNEVLANIAKYDLVFPNRYGCPLDKSNLLQRRLPALVKRAKITRLPGKLTLYSLRHTGATLSLKHGANIKAVAEKMGHTDTRMLFKHYAHVLPSMREEVTNVLAGALYEGE